MSAAMTVMPRRVEPEWLDGLPPRDPLALGSRRDLRKVNAIMGHARTLARRLPRLVAPPRSVLEIGAGDGAWMAGFAHALPASWSGARVVLLDRHETVCHAALSALARRGWHPEAVTADALEWLVEAAHAPFDLVIANLFLHHFDDTELRALLKRVASRSRAFAACEPRRCGAALASARLLGLIGCNAVTRHDARVSVRAGFTGRELASLWPRSDGWRLREHRCGWLTHLFIAVRSTPGAGDGHGAL